MQAQSTNKKIYLYGRLSKEDELQGDSNSIINQRNILTKYAEENGLKNYEFIYDDGYSGADFERPSFKKMIEEVEAGNVSLIAVKDLSRFGRDYLKVGFYTEMLFVEKDVRFIAINDNVDNAKGENDFVPMMNLFNEWFVRNTSKKIREVKQAKGKAGEKMTVYPKYGYRKYPDDKKPHFWHTTTIHKMLDTREYIGDIWEIVRKMREHKHRPTRHGNVGLFTGIAYCADCNEKLYFHTREIFNKGRTKSRFDGLYSCSTYRKQTQYQRNTEQGCTAHYIRENVLEQLVLVELRELLKFVGRNETEFAKMVMDKSEKEHTKLLTAKKAETQKIKSRICELDKLIERIYEDNVSGKITDKRFAKYGGF